jgi:hypothetical protein
MRLQPWTPLRTATCLVVIGLATLACLMPVHNDTWWHLRAGQVMLREQGLLFVDRFSYTAAGTFFWNHSWLAQLVFYPLFAFGGLPLLTAFCALLASGAWVLVWRMMRGPLDLRILLFALAVSASTSIWSLRPQVFSIALLPIVTWLVARDRWLWVVALMVLWANLHAGMAIGVVMAGASIPAALVADRDRLVMRLSGTAAAFAATLVTPLGITNWKEMLASMARSRANHIQEWQATPLPPEQLLFWGLATFFAWQVVRRWRVLESAEDRVLAVAALLTLPLAARALRNVPTFMMLAAPALTRVSWRPSDRSGDAPLAGRLGALVPTAVAVAAVAGAVIVWRAWTAPWTMLDWQPVSPAAAAAIRTCKAPLYNRYFDGGAIIWFVPEQKVFVDSRQDPFPISLVQDGSRVESTGDYEALFKQWHVNCAALPPDSKTAAHLARDGWTLRFRDSQWLVLQRPATASTAATPLPALQPGS